MMILDQQGDELLTILQHELHAFFAEVDAGTELLVHTDDGESAIEQPKIMALISFLSEHLQGNLQLLSCQHHVPIFYPALSQWLSDDLPQEEYAILCADSLGEVSNQLLGRFKNAMLRHSVDLKMGIPSLVKSTHFEVLSMSSPTTRSIFYVCAQRFLIQVRVSLVIHEDFKLKPYIQTASESMPQPGDMFIF